MTREYVKSTFQGWVTCVPGIQYPSLKIQENLAIVKSLNRFFRSARRTIRGFHLESWLLALLIVFTASDFVLRVPAMQLAGGSSLHGHSNGHHLEARKSLPGQHPASHDHQRCQLCSAPPLALPISSLSQLGKTRLELVEVLPVTAAVFSKLEFQIGLQSRAPPL